MIARSRTPGCSLLALFLLAALPASATPSRSGPRLDREQLLSQRFDATPGQTLRVQVPDADIVLRDGDDQHVQVVVWLSGRNRDRGRERFERMNFRADATGDGVSVQADRVSGMGWSFLSWGGYGLSVEVTVPVRYDLDVQTADGDITAQEHEGHVRLRTSDGDVFVRRVQGQLEISSSDGDLEVREGSGPAASLSTSDGDITLGPFQFDSTVISTSDGDIVADRLAGKTELQTSDGDITLSEVAGSLSARTHDGDIDVSLVQPAETSLRTGDGDITIRAPASLAATLDLRGEQIEFRHPGFEGERGRRHVQGSVGGGGPKLQATTSDGTIVLRLADDG